jgi:hypothetical protein
VFANVTRVELAALVAVEQQKLMALNAGCQVDKSRQRGRRPVGREALKLREYRVKHLIRI